MSYNVVLYHLRLLSGLVRSREHTAPPTISKLGSSVDIRTTLSDQKQRQPRNIVQTAHPALWDLIRAIRRRITRSHLTRVRARADNVASDAPF
jgi:hypothetical protein